MGKLIKLFNNNRGEEPMSINVYDVAKGFLALESMTHKKLQKLCYYAQAWHLALFKDRFFNSSFEAWIHGPVCPELYHEYREYGWNNIPMVKTMPGSIDEDDMEFIDMIYEAYGELTGDQLEELSHSEDPWREARKGLEEWEPSHNPIDENLMKKYYWAKHESNQGN